jgi:subtilisin family serine protease
MSAPRFLALAAAVFVGGASLPLEAADASPSSPETEATRVLIDRPVSILDGGLAAQAGGDPLRSLQWGLDHPEFPAAWSETTGAGVTVAVLDTGVDATHEDLAGQVLPGYDAITGRPGGGYDPHGHGTHVAGTIAARLGNGLGVAGAAPGAAILPVRVLGADGSGRSSDIAEGMVWAVDHGADVINLSLGGPNTTVAEAQALGYAESMGVLVVAAAGNEAQSGNRPHYPAAHPDVVAVAAVTPDRQRAAFSNVGAYVDLAAPGTAVVAPCPTTAAGCAADRSLPSGYARRSGTSMATPHAAAAAALLLAARPGLSPRDLRSHLQASAVDLGQPGKDPETGAGLINPVRALHALRAVPVASPVASPVPAHRPSEGYWVVSDNGRVAAVGSARWFGDASALPRSAPIVAAAARPTGEGYWLASADGGVFAFGDAPFAGSAAGTALNAPIVGMTATRSGEGYWLLAADGGIFSFGDAAFYGSTGDRVLNRPVVDIAVSPGGRGYWLVATDGGVFSFGDAVFAGSTGGIALNQPVTSMATAPGGYWLIARDGGVFSFGSTFWGSLPGLPEARGVVATRVRASARGDGYYILGVGGQVYPFGSAGGVGSSPGAGVVDLLVAP